MNFDNLGPAWRDKNQRASEEKRLERYVATSREVERFTERVFRRDLIETAACLYVIYAFGSYLFDRALMAKAAMPAVATLGLVGIVLGAVWVMIRLHWVRRSTPQPRLDAPIREYCDAEIERVEKQIALLRSVHLWYLSPFYVGAVLAILGFAGLSVDFWIATALVTLLYGAIFALNRFVASTSMTAIRDRLVWLRDSLEMDGEPLPEPPDPMVSEAAVRRLAWRIFWGSLAVGIGGIALGWWFDVDYPKRSPFDAVRWRGKAPEVRLGEDWYNLSGIDGATTQEIVAFCEKAYGERKWRQRFEEDLVEVLTRMGHKPHDVVKLIVSPVGSDQESVVKSVPMTEAKRWAIKRAAAAREDAGLPRSEIVD